MTVQTAEAVSEPTFKMNEEQLKLIQDSLKTIQQTIQADLAKEAHTQRTKLDTLQSKLNKPNTHGLRPDTFDGKPASDAVAWLDAFNRIANLSNWSPELQLDAFPLYLKGVAQAWFLTLSDETKGDIAALKTAFKERFTTGPHDWLLGQQLTTRKQALDEPIDDYIADITRLCKRLKLSDAECFRYFTQGLNPQIQGYVTLARPKTLQEAESMARMKELVDKHQPKSDKRSALAQMQTVLSHLFTQLPTSTKTVASASTPSALEQRIDDVSKQIQQLQNQKFMASVSSPVAAYDQHGRFPHTQSNRFRPDQPNRQIEQLQRQVARLEDDLKRYQNPRRPDFSSYGRSFRTVEGNPVCNFCQRVGHTWRTCRQRNRDPPVPPRNPAQPLFSGTPRSTNSNLNG